MGCRIATRPAKILSVPPWVTVILLLVENGRGTFFKLCVSFSYKIIEEILIGDRIDLERGGRGPPVFSVTILILECHMF